MDLVQLKKRPGHSTFEPLLWFTNKENLRQYITHPEWGIWKNQSIKKPQIVLSAPRDFGNILLQKHYLLQIKKDWTDTIGLCKYTAAVVLTGVTCYESNWVFTYMICIFMYDLYLLGITITNL